MFDIGAMAAGYESIWGLEWDDKIASIARLNDLPVITKDVTKMTPGDFVDMKRPDHLHASPPCPNFSIAKRGGKEDKLDILMAESVCYAITVLKPNTFTLENVPAYAHSLSFKSIVRTLHDLGYFVDWQNLNSANFGIPQTRNRLWIRASKKLMMPYPEPVKWLGWYQAIEDLIPSLPNSEFAPWQIARLPKEYKEFIIGQGTYSSPKDPGKPVDTITSNSNQTSIRAFILAGAGNTSFAEAKEGKGVRYRNAPAHTVTSGGGVRISTAFVLNGGNSNAKTFMPRNGNEPHHTVTGSMDKTPSKAWTAGRIVKITIQALGRFQTVPDSYKGLTVKINGNGVPCLLAQKVLETL